MDEANAGAGGSPEPSIEEILASIRRIISDDGEEAPADAAAEPEAAAAPVADKPEPVFEEPAREPDPEPVEAFEEILELTERVEEPEATPEPAMPSFRIEEDPMPPRRSSYDDDDALVSEPIARRAADVLSRVNPRGDDRTDDPLPIPHRTLEEVVREMLRPMLHQWLDAHLPGIVERAVERELRRVSRRAEELH